jgi:outer membrane protein TolC
MKTPIPNFPLLLFFSLFLSLPVHLFGQTDQTLPAKVSFSLLQAQDYAYEHNYDLRNSAYDVQIARKIVKQNTSIGLPQINGSATYNDYLSIPTSVVPNFLKLLDPVKYASMPDEMELQFGQKYNMTGALQLTQLLYSGQYLVGLKTAKAYLETSKQKNIRDQVDIRDQVAENYYGVLLVEENARILDTTYKVMSKMVEEARAAFQLGMIEDIDVDQLELNKSNLEASLANMKSQLTIAYNYLKFIVGLKEEQQLILTDNIAFFLAQVDQDALVNQPFDYRYNIDYRLLEKQEYMVKMQYKLSKTAYQPTLSGFLGISANAQRSEWNFFAANEPWYKTSNWGLSLQIPIWSSGNRKFAVDQAYLNVEKMKVNDEKLKVALQLQVETAKKDFNNTYQIYQNFKKGFDTSLKIYQKTMSKYKQGISTSTDLNQRYNQFLTSNRDYLISINELLKAKLRLAKLLEKF